MKQLFQAVKQEHQALKWPYTIGTVMSSHLQEGLGDDGDLLEVSVRYRYCINGQEYEGITIHPSYCSSNSTETHKKLVARLRPNCQVRVFYQPDNPANATLCQGMFFHSYMYLLFGVSFVLILLFFPLTFFFFIFGSDSYADGITLLNGR